MKKFASAVIVLVLLSSVVFAAEPAKPVKMVRHQGVTTEWAITFDSKPCLADVDRIAVALRGLTEKEGLVPVGSEIVIQENRAWITYKLDDKSSDYGRNQIESVHLYNMMGSFYQFTITCKNQPTVQESYSVKDLLEQIVRIHAGGVDIAEIVFSATKVRNQVGCNVQLRGGSSDYVKGITAAGTLK